MVSQVQEGSYPWGTPSSSPIPSMGSMDSCLPVWCGLQLCSRSLIPYIGEIWNTAVVFLGSGIPLRGIMYRGPPTPYTYQTQHTIPGTPSPLPITQIGRGSTIGRGTRRHTHTADISYPYPLLLQSNMYHGGRDRRWYGCGDTTIRCYV